MTFSDVVFLGILRVKGLLTAANGYLFRDQLQSLGMRGFGGVRLVGAFGFPPSKKESALKVFLVDPFPEET